MSNQIQIVNFHDQSLITLQKDNVAYVAMKSVCDNIGLDWEAQRQRISRDEVLNSTACMIKAVATDGKMRELLCLPIHYLNGWLFGVDVNRVKENNREKLITYKKECYQALHDYWHKGVAVNERMVVNTPALSTVKERNGLVKTCEWFVRVASYLDYSEVYNLVHHRFNVDKLSELTTEQVGQATEYLQGLLLQAIARQRGFNSQDPTPLPPMHRTDVGQYYDGALWTRILEPDEQIVRTKDIPQLIINEPYIDGETLTAINYASSARLASMLKNPPFLSTLDNAKEV